MSSQAVMMRTLVGRLVSVVEGAASAGQRDSGGVTGAPAPGVRQAAHAPVHASAHAPAQPHHSPLARAHERQLVAAGGRTPEKALPLTDDELKSF
jgi:hypothetical protein